ncbi:MAG: triphosphoribosyl-dephospho-CoA synthase [Candidatus Hydrothermarchaeaceae archaeon]
MDADDIVACGQLACILEATCPKPGNVSRFRDFGDTTFEHFMAGCIGTGEALRQAVGRGVAVGAGKMSSSELRLGTWIRKAVEDSRSWHTGGNTNLGTIMLFVPLAAAAGISLAVHKGIENQTLRTGVDKLIRESTFVDTVEFYQAIRIANPGGMGHVKRYDITSESAKAEIEADDVNLYRIFSLSKADSIAKELVTKMAITFEVGYPVLREAYEKGGNISQCILRVFFEILSRHPDTLIARKNGLEVARGITRDAQSILEEGLEGERIRAFDEKLRSRWNRLNPGTTADLVASSLNVALLNGLKVR